MIQRLALLLLLALPALPASGGERAKLIQFGWGMPDAAYVRDNVGTMERVPFDGIVLNPRFVVDGHVRNLRTSVFHRHALPASALERSAADLRVTKFRRFSDNFVVLAMVPGDVDWFDDWSSVLHNTRVATRLVRDARLRGILLDPEQYQEPLFAYALRPQRGSRSLAEYAGEARRRGREWIGAVNAEAPRITVLLAFGHAAASWPREGRKDYSLLPAFLDGIIEGADPATTIVDGYEFSYGYKRRDQFVGAIARMRGAADALSLVPRLHATRVRTGFGLWLDYRSHVNGWHPWEPERNHFSPEEFARALRDARSLADGYVWVYSERLNWWTGEGVNRAYVQALEP